MLIFVLSRRLLHRLPCYNQTSCHNKKSSISATFLLILLPKWQIHASCMTIYRLFCLRAKHGIGLTIILNHEYAIA